MELSKFVKILELEFPPETAWSEDKIGLQIRTNKSQINNVFLTLELDEATVSEAISLHSDIIITFHPLIFHPLDDINYESRIGNLVSQLIKNDINLYAIHTNFDSHPYGTSYELCNRLGFDVSSYLEENTLFGDRGMGIITDLQKSIRVEELLDKVMEVCNSPIKYNISSSPDVRKLAILAGSGSGYIATAIKNGCDAIITADVKYHNFHSTNGKITVIDPGHYEMEQFVPKAMQSILKRILGNKINISLSSVLTNPVRYFPDNSYTQRQKNYLNN